MINSKFLKVTIFLILGLITFGFLNKASTMDVQADTLCPSYMDPDSVDCLDYLRDQLGDLKSEQDDLQDQLSEEKYLQLSLEEKISYITNQIYQTEKVIETLEVEIAANDVQIKLLEEDIQEKEDYISLMKQEINALEGSVNERIMESYKYSFVGTLELVLDSNGLGDVLRKIKYLAITRSQDTQYLEEYSLMVISLEEEEVQLEEQQAELQIVRNAIEDEKSELVAEKKNLDSQKAEKDRLLAQSKAEQQAIVTQLSKNQEQQSVYDAAIIAYIEAHGDQMANQGWVSSGTWIGRVSGEVHACSTGAHLHFGMTSTDGSFAYANKPLLSGYYVISGRSPYIGWDGWVWPYISAGSMRLPLEGTVILSQDYHQGYSLDMWRPGIAEDPVYAVKDGQLWKGRDQCGSNYAVVFHDDNTKTIYLHLE